ncbi:hypothetical protein PAXRUDRAFT_168562 [Paxillus rubicundulus Ve08.2h10]|uniref:Uncharacterized protein n=1 Tax=Paxillus rubicundulus Ve08.2h10 TaxID=930991 RepID=A0A0D0D010_9AGAM|nr:hypothetical protein PAXRUDRAFT_168562 [Paxillus rubicundulus Ve08.2h10]
MFSSPYMTCGQASPSLPITIQCMPLVEVRHVAGTLQCISNSPSVQVKMMLVVSVLLSLRYHPESITQGMSQLSYLPGHSCIMTKYSELQNLETCNTAMETQKLRTHISCLESIWTHPEPWNPCFLSRIHS